jgi:hypothetical protein
MPKSLVKKGTCLKSQKIRDTASNFDDWVYWPFSLAGDEKEMCTSLNWDGHSGDSSEEAWEREWSFWEVKQMCQILIGHCKGWTDQAEEEIEGGRWGNRSLLSNNPPPKQIVLSTPQIFDMWMTFLSFWLSIVFSFQRDCFQLWVYRDGRYVLMAVAFVPPWHLLAATMEICVSDVGGSSVNSFNHTLNRCSYEHWGAHDQEIAYSRGAHCASNCIWFLHCIWLQPSACMEPWHHTQWPWCLDLVLFPFPT